MSDEKPIINNTETQMFITGEDQHPPVPSAHDLISQEVGKQVFADPMSMPTGSLLPGIYWPASSPLNGMGPNGINWRSDAIFTSARIPGVPDAWPGTYAYYRIMLADPTIRIARAVANAPIMASSWNIEVDDDAPDGAKELIEVNLLPKRRTILQSMMLAMDYGWVGFEKIYEVMDGNMQLKCLKQLLHEISVILVDGQTGDWTGFANRDSELAREKALLFTYDQEAGNLYGRSKMENLRGVMPAWKDCNDAAARYDRKVSGVFPMVHYPPGTSRNISGTPKDNYEIATSVLHNISAGQGIAVPNEFASSVDDRTATGPEKRRWIIELLEDKGARQPGFITRLEYLDKLKSRGYLVPERATLEGTHGTKAEAQTHGDLVVTIAEHTHADIVQTINEQIVDQILELNWGAAAKGKVRINAMPVVNDVRDFIRSIVKAILTQGNSAAEILLSTVNIESLLEQSEVPVLDNPVSQDELRAQVEAKPAPQSNGLPPHAGDALGSPVPPQPDPKAKLSLHIKRLPSGKYRLYSKKKDSQGKRKNLGTFDTLAEASKHEQAVEFFKNAG